VLRSAYPRAMWASDYPWGRSEELYRLETERDLRLFGSREEALEVVRARGLQFADDDEAQQWINYFRWSGSPGSVEALAMMNKEIDARQVLPAIRVPTLVLHGTKDAIVPIGVAQYLAAHIPGATLVEMPNAGHLATGEAAHAVNVELRGFLNEVWESGGWEESERDRLLATVLFTDIVGASERLASLGDRAWGDLLRRHTSSSADSSCASAEARWTRPVTASLLPSTARHARFGVHARSAKRSVSSGCRCG
jgi:alpha/beta hydrolase fold